MCPVQIINRLAARHPITSIPCVAAILGLCSDRHTHQFGRRRFSGLCPFKTSQYPGNSRPETQWRIGMPVAEIQNSGWEYEKRS